VRCGSQAIRCHSTLKCAFHNHIPRSQWTKRQDLVRTAIGESHGKSSRFVSSATASAKLQKLATLFIGGGTARALQAAERLVSAVILSEALECGSRVAGPHSKAACRPRRLSWRSAPALTSFSAACLAPEVTWLQGPKRPINLTAKGGGAKALPLPRVMNNTITNATSASVLSQKYGYIVFQSWPESNRPWLSRQRVGIGCWRSARIDRFSLPVP